MSKRKECSCKELYPDWVHVSPSQIKTECDCNRKWAFDKIDKRPRTTSTGAAFGTAMHNEGEEWYRFRTAPSKEMPGKCFAQGIGKKDFLPSAPRKGLLIEHHFVLELLELDRVLLHGYIDLLVPDLDLRIVTDYKYTKSRKWIPTLPELQVDPQVLIYAAAGFMLYEEMPNEVETRWCYFVTNADRSKVKGTAKRSIIWTPDRLNETGQFDRIVEDAAHIAGMRRTLKKATDATPNFAACQKYGGCEFGPRYADVCPREGSKALAHIRQDDRFRADKETLTKLNTGER